MKNAIILSLAFLLFQTFLSAQETPWEWSVYRIQVHFELENAVLEQFDVRSTEEFIEKNTPKFLETTRNWVGGLWSLSFVPGRFPLELYNDALPREEISPNVLEKYPFFRETLQSPFEKLIYVHVEPDENGLKLSVREIDVRTLTSFGKSTKFVRKTSDFNDILCDGMLSVFSLSANIDLVQQGKVVLHIRGGELLPDSLGLEKTGTALAPGSIFVPFLRTWNRSREIEVVKAIPWTALLVESVQRSRVECRLESGLRHSLSVRRRGRSEQIAILPRLEKKDTTLRLIPRVELAKKNQPKNEDSGVQTQSVRQVIGKYRIFEKTPENEKGDFLGVSDPDGTFVIPYSPDSPIRQLIIRDGAMLVARLPLIQGWSSEYVVGVPDDETRVLAEGFLQGVQEEVLDLIALREILKARIAKAQQTGDSALLAKSKSEYDRLKRPQQIVTELDLARRKYRSSDPIVQRRLDIMFDATRKVVGQYQD